jgi:hypothetical protein
MICQSRKKNSCHDLIPNPHTGIKIKSQTRCLNFPPGANAFKILTLWKSIDFCHFWSRKFWNLEASTLPWDDRVRLSCFYTNILSRLGVFEGGFKLIGSVKWGFIMFCSLQCRLHDLTTGCAPDLANNFIIELSMHQFNGTLNNQSISWPDDRSVLFQVTRKSDQSNSAIQSTCLVTFHKFICSLYSSFHIHQVFEFPLNIAGRDLWDARVHRIR